MDKLHDSRKQFEEWLKFHSDDNECLNLLATNDSGSNYLHPRVDLSWIAWQASRASIVVDLPEMEDFELLDGYKVRESLRSIGLSIKGDRE
ncbi:hypothetical protein FHC77_08115 [Atlantibacter hermannii]|uniref:hypothetical protein n=1 Tax=Atlantibacter hermannii TaxID=565 RepID=UPI001C7046CE|nr:hypothetical protein [Atlantibacter hermannii]MBW9430710.1 hypothetical protein [Atlantibacter hermannii]